MKIKYYYISLLEDKNGNKIEHPATSYSYSDWEKSAKELLKDRNYVSATPILVNKELLDVTIRKTDDLRII